MRCDKCGAEVGEGPCLNSQCGREFTARKNVILCQGIKKDGTRCKAEIQKKSKVCGECRTSVDPQWFSSTVITCQGQGTDGSFCGNIIDEEEEFCTKCIIPRPTKLTDPVAKNETKIHSAEICVKEEGAQMVSGPDASLNSGLGMGIESAAAASQKEDLEKKETIDRANNSQACQGGLEEENSNERRQNATNQDTNNDNAFVRPKISSPGDRNYVCLHFHVLVSPDFKLNWEKHRVMIEINLMVLEGWKCLIYKMNHVRQVQKYEEMHVLLKVEKQIAFESGFSYLYAIYNEQKKKMKREHYYKSSWTRPNRRYFHALTKRRDKNEYHQYDGIMNRDKGFRDNVVNTFSSDYVRKLEEDAAISAEIFTQEKLLSTKNMEAILDPETLNMLEMLLSGLEYRYQQDAKCWSSQDGFKEKMAKAILPHILKSLEAETETPLIAYMETKQQAERRMQVALFVLTVIGRFKFPLSAHKSLLAKSLLLRPHHETGELHDLAVALQKSSLEKRSLSAYIIDLCSSFQMNDEDPSWLCCIPLLHLFSGDVKPYQTPTHDIKHDAHEPHWWGIKSIKSTVEKIRQCSKNWMIPLEDIISCLSPLFELDYFLPRTLMSVLQLKEVEMMIQTKTVPPEVCIATCIYYIKETRSKKHSSPATEDKQIISSTRKLKEFLAKFEAPGRWTDALLLQHTDLTQKIAEGMVIITFDESCPPDLLREVVQVFLEAVALYDTTQEKLDPNRSKNQQKDMLKNVHAKVKVWLRQKFSRFTSEDFTDNLKRWQDMLCSTDFKAPFVAEMWNTFIVDDFKKQWEIERRKGCARESTLVEQYCSLVFSLHPCLQSVLGDLALKVIPTLYNVPLHQQGEFERERFGRLLSTWYERDWEAAMNKRDMEEDRIILRHILNWTPFSHFLKMFCVDERKYLSKKCIENLERAISIIEDKIKTLENGEVTIRDLTEIKKADSKFQELTLIITEKYVVEKMGKIIDTAKAVMVRQIEVDSYKKQMKYVTTLAQLCQHIPTVDLEDLDSNIERLTKQEDLRVRDICQPVTVGTITTDNFHPKITAFNISDEVVTMLEPLQKLYESNIFMNLWSDIGCQAKFGSQPTSLEEVCEKVWKPVSTKMKEVTQKLVTGEIQCAEMEKYLGEIYRDNYDGMVGEMICIKVPKEQAEERIKQLKQFRQLAACVVGAEAISDIVDAYGLKGDFDVIKTIISQQHASKMMMMEFDDSLLDTCAFLQDFTTEKTVCLNAFIECKQLVLWLKESVKGLKELKVFVDLASISAGEGDMEIARVNCLHAAVTGFAALIFDLDENAGFKELIDKCQILWKELKADLNLPKKLRDTQRHLEWLKAVKQGHGSVEVTSLAQTEAINSKGIFLVGALDTTGDTSMVPVYLEFKTEVAEDVLNNIRITYGQKGIDSFISDLKQLAKVDTHDDRVLVLCDSKHAEDVQKCVISYYNRAEKERKSQVQPTKKYLINGGNYYLKEWLEFAFGHTSWSKNLQVEEGKLYLLGSVQMKREVEKAVQSMNQWYQEEFTLSAEEQQKADEVVTLIKNELPAVFIKQTRERIAVLSDNEDNIERAKYKVEVALGRIKIVGRGKGHTNPQAYGKSFSCMSKDDQMDAGLMFPLSSFQSNQPTVDLAAKSYCIREGLTAKVYLGNLTSLPVDCIVNASNGLLSHDGGVAQAISKAAGREFDHEGEEYVKQHGPIPVTQCCVTSSGKLPYKVVIHAVEPRWSDYKYNEKERCTDDLKKTIVNCLIEANKFKMASIAIPSLSSGIFGVPKPLCAQMYAQAVVEYSMTYGLQSVKEIHFVDMVSDMCQLTQSAFDAQLQCS